MKNRILQPPAPAYQGAEISAQPRPGLNLIGVPFDGTACFRKGTAAGPAAVRRVSEHIESYSPYLDLDLEEIGVFYDLGDLAVTASGDPRRDWQSLQDSFAGLAEHLDESTRVLALGGEHSISAPFIARCLALYPDLLLLHLDAHADLRDGYQGFAYSHASTIRRCLDHFGPDHRLAQFGIRSGTRAEFAWMRRERTLYAELADFIAFLEKIPPEKPLYLTLDLDFFDPACLPGTGTPEAGGEDFRSLTEIVTILKNKRVVGGDVVELAPAIDPTGNSEVFATTVVRELILAMAGEGGHGR
ncbi:MAG: agmatinase [Desulfurivibrionaceae bacterium]